MRALNQNSDPLKAKQEIFANTAIGIDWHGIRFYLRPRLYFAGRIVR